MKNNTITPDTTLHTWSATNDGEGSLLESVLGNRSCGDYAREFAHLTEAQDLAQTCAWFADYPEGIYLSEAEARADWENRPAEYYSVLDSRTPREIRTVILNGAAEETACAAEDDSST